MARFILPEDRPRRYRMHIPVCFGLTTIPALILALLRRPFTQEHIGLLLAAVLSGGFIYWTSANLLTGVYTSKQGTYHRHESPLRYWIHTGVIGAVTAFTVYFLIHQAELVLAASQVQSKLMGPGLLPGGVDEAGDVLLIVAEFPEALDNVIAV